MSAQPSPWAIVAATFSDLDDLARLEQACLADPWSAHDLETYLRSGAIVAWRLVDPARTTSALAYALFQLLPSEAELLRLGVEPGRRRTGLARTLVADCLDRLAVNGHPVCHLEVRAGNRPARALYERLGFTLSGRRRAYYSDGEDAVRYRREIGPPGG